MCEELRASRDSEKLSPSVNLVDSALFLSSNVISPMFPASILMPIFTRVNRSATLCSLCTRNKSLPRQKGKSNFAQDGSRNSGVHVFPVSADCLWATRAGKPCRSVDVWKRLIGYTPAKSPTNLQRFWPSHQGEAIDSQPSSGWKLRTWESPRSEV